MDHTSTVSYTYQEHFTGILLLFHRCVRPSDKGCGQGQLLVVYCTDWESEYRYFLYGTSAQLCHTVPFTLVHNGKYRTEDKLKIQTIQILNTTQQKQTTHCTIFTRITFQSNSIQLLIKNHFNCPINTNINLDLISCSNLQLELI